MTMRRVLFLALALALLLGCTTVLAQEDEGEDAPMDDNTGDDDTVEAEDDEEARPRDPNAHPLTDIPSAASDVVTSFVFPNITEPGKLAPPFLCCTVRRGQRSGTGAVQ